MSWIALSAANNWWLDVSVLTLLSSEVKHSEAKVTEQAIAEQLRSLCKQLVTDYFDHFNAATKKAEHAEMLKLSITSLSYDQYLKLRQSGGTPADACYGLRNEAWLRTLAKEKSRDAEFEQLLAAYPGAKQAVNDAYKSIVRQSVAQTKLITN
jgi:hypothetical protein